MKDVLVRENGVPRNAVEEGLQHALATRNHCRVLFRFRLLDSIVTDSLLGRDGWDDERRVELHETES